MRDIVQLLERRSLISDASDLVCGLTIELDKFRLGPPVGLELGGWFQSGPGTERDEHLEPESLEGLP